MSSKNTPVNTPEKIFFTQPYPTQNIKAQFIKIESTFLNTGVENFKTAIPPKVLIKALPSQNLNHYWLHMVRVISGRERTLPLFPCTLDRPWSALESIAHIKKKLGGTITHTTNTKNTTNFLFLYHHQKCLKLNF